MNPFTFTDGERVMRFAAGAADELPRLLGDRGFGDGPVLFTTQRARGDIPDGLIDGAGDVFDVAPGPVPDAAAALLSGVAGRDVVAFGGGRVVDAAKAVVAAGGGRVAAVPTTLAGSSFTPFHRMPTGYDGYGGATRPALVACDPALMTSAPRDVLTATAMNALAHGIESLYAPGANPVTDGAALRGAPLVLGALEAAEVDREGLALGALLGGYAVGVASGLVVHHAMCQTLVGVLGTPHAQTNAVMLPRSIAFMADRAPEPLARLAESLEASDVPAVAERVARVAADAGVTTLAEIGVSESELDEVLDAVMMHPGIAAAPGAPAETSFAHS